jgi:formylmethanofuran dehydrogenase subunit E
VVLCKLFISYDFISSIFEIKYIMSRLGRKIEPDIRCKGCGEYFTDAFDGDAVKGSGE